MPLPARLTMLTPRQAGALRRLLLVEGVRCCSSAALRSLARRGFTLGEAGGHALTSTGRTVAEACQDLPDRSWIEFDRLTLLARAVPRPHGDAGTDAQP